MQLRDGKETLPVAEGDLCKLRLCPIAVGRQSDRGAHQPPLFRVRGRVGSRQTPRPRQIATIASKAQIAENLTAMHRLRAAACIKRNVVTAL